MTSSFARHETMTSRLLDLFQNQFDTRVFLLADCDEVFQKLELHQVELEEMRQNKDAGSFLDEIIKWQSILQNIESVVKVWLQAQQSWLTLDEVGLTCSNGEVACPGSNPGRVGQRFFFVIASRQ